MKAKKRSPEALAGAKSAWRREVDELREARRRGSPEARERLREIDGRWPVGLFDALNGPVGDPRSLDTLLRFLEDDPYFDGTGYIKEIALKRLGHWPLDPDDRLRIAHIVLTAVDGPTAREFRRQCKAAKHADRAVLVPGLLARLDSPDESKRWRAYCAAVGMLQEEWPRRSRYGYNRPIDEARSQIDGMRNRLDALVPALVKPIREPTNEP